MLASALVRMLATGPDARGERFGVFTGLRTPTIFILSNRFGRYATSWAPAVEPSVFS